MTTELRAGPLTAELDGIDLRAVCRDGIEAFRRVYVAVRDPDWNTIPGVVGAIDVAADTDRFEVSFTVDHVSGSIDYSWRGTITGTAAGLIVYRMDGAARSDFAYNRIGFCVLHPDDECAGQSFLGIGPDGPISGRLPDTIAPQPFENGLYVPLVPPTSTLDIDLRSGGHSHLECVGDLFETEDQRNWTDASYKTYSTPMALGVPHHATRGQAVSQLVRLSATAGPGPVTRRPRTTEVTLLVGGHVGHRMPLIGLGPSSAADAVADEATQLLRTLGAHHVRVDVSVRDPDCESSARRAIALAHAIECPLELALFTGLDDDLSVAAALFADVPIARIVTFVAGAETATPDETTPAAVITKVQNEFASLVGDPPVGGGTDMYFCELNRTRPESGAMDFVAYSIMPQEHATDDRTLFENLRPQAETVRAAGEFAGGRPIVVGPITLLPRGRRPQTDERQPTSLIGAWTAGSIAYLAAAGAHAVSYYEPAGERGVVGAGGEPTPASDVLRWATAHVGAGVRACSSDDDRRVVGLAIEGDGNSTVLAVNLTAQSVDVRISGVAGRAGLLDVVIGASELRRGGPDDVSLSLGPHAVAALRT